ncbi:MAG: tetratricopeptide repeat protein [Panacagrimonas sp.]
MTTGTQWRELAVQQYQLGQLDGALDSLCRGLGEDPDDATSHAMLALVLYRKKRLHAADYEAAMALRLEPEMDLACHAMGLVRLAQHRLPEAEAMFQRVLAEGEEFTPTLLAYSTLEVQRGQRAAAHIWLQRAVAASPDDPDTWAALAEWNLDTGDLAVAEDHARRALEVHAEHADALSCMGFVLLARGQMDEAREHALWALRVDPANVGALSLLAGVKARRSLALGLWWRWNVWLGAMGEGRLLAVLIGLFLAVQFAQLLLGDLGYPIAMRVVSWTWIAFAIYTWVGPAWFARELRKELETVRLDSRY